MIVVPDQEETARALGVSARPVRRDWAFARTWLYRSLSGDVKALGPHVELADARCAVAGLSHRRKGSERTVEKVSK